MESATRLIVVFQVEDDVASAEEVQKSLGTEEARPRRRSAEAPELQSHLRGSPHRVRAFVSNGIWQD